MSKWRLFKKQRDAFMEGFKASKDARERKRKANENKRKQAVQRLRESLENFAASILVEHNLRQSPEAPMFLRLFLRRKVLEKQKRTRKENDGMVLADSACQLLNIILKNRYGRVSLEEGQTVYKSIATIMRIAGPILKGTERLREMNETWSSSGKYPEVKVFTKEFLKRYFERTQKSAEQNLKEITKRAGEQVFINRLRLMETIKIGNAAISELAKGLPEQTQIALDTVEKVIERMS